MILSHVPNARIWKTLARADKFLDKYFWYWIIPLLILLYVAFFQRYPQDIWIVNYIILATVIFLILFTIIFCPVLVLAVLITIVALLKGEKIDEEEDL